MLGLRLQVLIKNSKSSKTLKPKGVIPNTERTKKKKRRDIFELVVKIKLIIMHSCSTESHEVKNEPSWFVTAFKIIIHCQIAGNDPLSIFNLSLCPIGRNTFNFSLWRIWWRTSFQSSSFWKRWICCLSDLQKMRREWRQKPSHK